MKKTVLIVAIAIVMIGCISCDQKKEKTVSNRFPGFTQVGSTGEWSKLYLDLKSAQKEGLTVTFKFIQVVEGGYVIQEGATDCRSNFLRMDGVQYKDDGTSDRKYPGDVAPMSYQNQPGIAELIRLACNKTGLPTAPAAPVAAAAPETVAPGAPPAPEALPTQAPTSVNNSNIESTIRNYYQAVQDKRVDYAINMYSTQKKPKIKVGLLHNIASDTEYYRINSINVTSNDGIRAQTVVNLSHKKYNKSEENWEVYVSLINENGVWKIDSTPGRKL